MLSLLDTNDVPDTIRAKCKEHGGRFLAERVKKGVRDNRQGFPSVIYDGVQYEYRAVFNSDEEVDEFLEEINASKSDRDIIGGYLTVFFSVHDDHGMEEDEEN